MRVTLRVIRLSFFTQPCWLGILLVFVAFVKADPIFKSDFELGKTTTDSKILAYARSVELTPNHRVHQWPLDGGQGVVEGNLQGQREVFQYESRTGSILKGVAGLKRNHPKGADIRTTGLAEWDQVHADGKFIQSVVSPRLFGSHCARFSVTGFAVLEKTMKTIASECHHRFYISLSKDLFNNPSFRLPVFYASRLPLSLYRVFLVRSPNSNKMFLCLGAIDESSPLTNQSSRDTVFLSPNTKYCVEYAARFGKAGETRIRAEVSLFVNGRFQARKSGSFPRPEKRNHRFQIGKLRKRPSLEGNFFVDEIAFAHHRISPIPEKPVLRFSNHVLQGSPIEICGRGKHQATHWQIHTTNSWTLPIFDGGEDMINLTSLHLIKKHMYRIHDGSGEYSAALPLNLGNAKSCYARVRYRLGQREWGMWSSPLLFRRDPEHAFSPAKDESLPLVTDAFFARPGARRPMTEIRANQWYDFYLHIRDPKGWENLKFATVVFSGQPEACEASHENKGDVFRARDNYVVTFTVGRILRVLAKQEEGSWNDETLANMKSLYCDTRQDNLAQNRKQGWVKMRMRLLEQAVSGPWAIKAYAANCDFRLSPMYRTLFHVGEKETMRGKTSYFALAFWVLALLGCAGCLTLLVRRTRKNGTEPVELLDVTIVPSRVHLPVKPGYEMKIQKARDFIVANYTRPIFPKDVAEAIGVSPGRLSHLFREATGKTAIGYINELRVEHAKILLKSTGSIVVEIASQVGYNSVDAFSKSFRKAVGKYPSQYREKRR